MRAATLGLAILILGCGDGDDGASVVVSVIDLKGAPLADATVLFQDEDGRIVSRKASGADGKATGSVPADGMVTVLFPEIELIQTIVGVQPGDELVAGHQFRGVSFTGELVVQMDDVVANATDYTVDFGCTTGTPQAILPMEVPPITVPIRGDCPARAPLVAVAFDVDRVPLAYAVLPDVGIEADTTVDLPPWRTDFSTATLALADLRDVEHTVYTRSFSAGVAHTYLGESVTPGEGPVTLRFPMEFGDSHEYVVHWTDFNTGALSTIRHISPTAPSGELAISGDDFLPVPSSPTAEGESLVWTFDGSSSEIDAQYVSVTFGPPEAGAATFTWSFNLPPDARSVTFPELPEELAEMYVRTPYPWYSLLSGAIDASWATPDEVRALGNTAWVAGAWADPVDLPDEGVLRASQSQL